MNIYTRQVLIICTICGQQFASNQAAARHARQIHELSPRRGFPNAQEMRDLLAEAASLLRDKHTPDHGQLRTQWDQDVDEWLLAVKPLIQEER